VDPLEQGDPAAIGQFSLLGRLGEGGMAVVYLGESPGHRLVAVKVMHRHLAGDAEYRRRFSEEVKAAREVGGFISAQVLDADPDAEFPKLPWMATSYIHGPTLARAIDEQGPFSEAEVRRLGAALAESLEEIHKHGYIHRDLKPSNVIMAHDGPRIIDFGIVRNAAVTSITAPGAAIGTPEYMAPEQLSGQRGEKLTSKCDIFALGGVLTYAATGHAPFTGVTAIRLYMQIVSGQPDLDPAAGELRRILAECLEKEPGDRPAAAELLARFNSPAAIGEAATIGMTRPVAVAQPPPRVTPPLVPRRHGYLPTGRRWLIPLAAVGVVAVIGIAVVGFAYPGIFLPHKHSGGGSSAAGASATGTLAAPLSPAGRVAWSVAFGPNDVLACADGDGSTNLWNTASGKHTALTDQASQGGVFSVAFAPNGTLATGGDKGRTELWNPVTRKLITTFPDTSGQIVPSVAFGPDGILATDQVSSTDLWNPATRKLIAKLPDPRASAGVFSLAFAPDGTLAVGDHNGRVYLWNTATRKITATLTDPTSDGVDAVAFAPSGVLATADGNGNTYLWDTATRKITATLIDPASVGVDGVAFAPNGTVLATGDGNGNTYLWNTATRKITATLTDPASAGVKSVAFAPNGTVLATADGNGKTSLWNITYHAP
jgi:hypothetical protein